MLVKKSSFGGNDDKNRVGESGISTPSVTIAAMSLVGTIPGYNLVRRHWARKWFL